MQFETSCTWVQTATFSIQHHLGIDGISLFLVILTTFLTPLAILCSWQSITKQVKPFMICLLALETGMIGVFCALDLVLFYVFWEVMLIPMYFLIGIWGGERRIYAAVKFILYTMVGSLLMLVGILYLFHANGGTSFDLVQITRQISMGTLRLSAPAEFWLFMAFLIAFAIKVPMFPFHTWLPDAHVEAPTAGSVILAGVLLKMGTYGMLRFCLPSIPDGVRQHGACLIGPRDHRHHLWSPRSDGAAGPEEACRLFLGQPYGTGGSGNFFLHHAGAARLDASDAEPWAVHRSALPACRHDL